MKWTEYHHAWIVSEYYRILKEQWRERGIAAFRQAACTYGEQRGKRMAMRAIKDGQPLNLQSYFAYGEYSATPEFFQVDMWETPDAVNEKVTRCPWAELFAQRGLKDCGDTYCREIDQAIVRGFCPDLHLDTTSTQHYGSCCRFYFRQEETIEQDLLARADELTEGRMDIHMPMAYHCAHVYHVFAAVTEGVFGTEGKKAAELVLSGLGQVYGEEAAQSLRKGAQVPFDTVICREEWEKSL